MKFIDMSADFRLRDPAVYKTWYGHEHQAPELQNEAVYGLTEHYRTAIRDARLVACPGCYPTAVLLALLPIVSTKEIDDGDIIIDAKSGSPAPGAASSRTSSSAKPARAFPRIRSASIAMRRKSSRRSPRRPAAT